MEKISVNFLEAYGKIKPMNAVNNGPAGSIVRQTGNDAAFALFAREDGSGGLTFSYDADAMVCTVDRSGMDKRFNEKVGEVLTMPLRTPLKKMQIFIDRSSVEMFVNDGEETFTTHLYPTERERWFRTAGKISTTVWSLKASVEDSFVV